ncbi:MAG: methyltransferase domain-containing protein [Candidatus Aminicenantes bacterium]|nr:methyltransferase domain-containing protein [Candidatus Aminicenantes bacterium]NIM77593.1 methyltransferase domain-containing protein [Candidatus Aminicenantes bacterium]NIN16907.1 methyltransferase domain-containing protein [Candidatus Aminicenantes bacterium]NIN40800.1 methyltransferase domain-containing protein [Candidatus Aminicenantes bacterium]NIN83604.1 methyltransferase domain-containing protein [Candidatus Aminicenantes bacterium]
MDYIRTGIQRILESPTIFKLFKKIVGGCAVERRLVNEFIRPFPGAKILDIGCGLGSHLDYISDTVEYVGYDLNARYIAYAKKKYKGRGQFFCSHISEASNLPLADQFDIALAISVLHHLNDDEAKYLFKSSHNHLKEGAVLITFDNVYTPNQSAIARYFISKDRGKYVRMPEEYEDLARECFSRIETTTLTDMLRIPYTHFIMRCTKQSK